MNDRQCLVTGRTQEILHLHSNFGMKIKKKKKTLMSKRYVMPERIWASFLCRGDVRQSMGAPRIPAAAPSSKGGVIAATP